MKKGKTVFLSVKPSCALTTASEILGKSSLENFFIRPNKQPANESPNLLFVTKDSLVASGPPVYVEVRTAGVLVDPENENREEIIEYTVQKGDKLLAIAERFGISLDTILWANNLTASSKIRVGQSLIILPISGVLHYVETGDTVASLAKTYKAEIEKIIVFNHLPEDGEILRGDILVIPEGVMPPKQVVAVPGTNIPVPLSYFLRPVPSSYRITQGLHWFNAIDFSNGACNGPVYAAAGGKVQRIGLDRVAGRFVRIEHPNTVATFYGHLANILVNPGEEVSQGQIIGYIGTTGYSTGCHLHFAVYGAKNPFGK